LVIQVLFFFIPEADKTKTYYNVYVSNRNNIKRLH
jgi:hypothetical protein